MPLTITPNLAPVGAELSGIDLRSAVAADELAALRAALDRYGMIFLRNQPLSPAQFVAFSALFGTLEAHVFDQFVMKDQPEVLVLSNIVEDGRQVGVADAGQFWHVDGAFNVKPHLYSMLNAKEIPVGADGQPLGDTMFTSTIHAFETLAPAVQAALRPRRGLHSLIRQYEKKAHSSVGPHVPLTPEQRAAKPDRYHPAVWPHPRTGRENLYVNEGTTFGFADMSDDDAEPLLRELFAHIVRPQVIYHHQWQVGDVLVWDNCAVQHKVNFNFGPEHRRRMHRTTVTGW